MERIITGFKQNGEIHLSLNLDQQPNSQKNKKELDQKLSCLSRHRILGLRFVTLT